MSSPDSPGWLNLTFLLHLPTKQLFFSLPLSRSPLLSSLLLLLLLPPTFHLESIRVFYAAWASFQCLANAGGEQKHCCATSNKLALYCTRPSKSCSASACCCCGESLLYFNFNANYNFVRLSRATKWHVKIIITQAEQFSFSQLWASFEEHQLDSGTNQLRHPPWSARVSFNICPFKCDLVQLKAHSRTKPSTTGTKQLSL